MNNKVSIDWNISNKNKNKVKYISKSIKQGESEFKKTNVFFNV